MEQWVRNYLFKSFDVQFRRDCRAINIEQMENLRLIIILDLREQHERRARLVGRINKGESTHIFFFATDTSCLPWPIAYLIH